MRALEGISQLELALRLGVSQRHVSFVELGRARPSRDLIFRWANETQAGMDERNAALLSAGFSPASVEVAPGQIRGSPACKALCEMLAAHEPNPGLVFDSDWMICAMNEAGQWLCTLMMPEFLADKVPTELDMIAAVADPGGLLSKVRNASEVGYALLRQLHAEQLARPSLRSRVDELERSLKERFGQDVADEPRPAGRPHLTLTIDLEESTLSFLLLQSLFELPQNVTQASLRSELWFPLDATTRSFMAAGRASVENSFLVPSHAA